MRRRVNYHDEGETVQMRLHKSLKVCWCFLNLENLYMILPNKYFHCRSVVDLTVFDMIQLYCYLIGTGSRDRNLICYRKWILPGLLVFYIFFKNFKEATLLSFRLISFCAWLRFNISRVILFTREF